MLLALHRHENRRSAFPGTRLWAALAGAGRAVLALPARVAEQRRLMGQLAGMNDYELRDIGLRRQDVQDAGALPYGSDPSLLWKARADERRRFSHR